MSTKGGEHEMHRKLLIFLAALSSLALGFGQEQKVPQGWNAATIQWQSTSPDGTKWAVLEGKADVPGEAFTYAAFVPGGYHDHHSHSSDARVAVVQGALKVGFGPDPSHLETYKVGSFLFVPANVEHTMAADEDTIIIGTATGPWSTHHHDHQGHHDH
jgi:quercetin dioxygenase-like cupin family protein